MPRWDDEDVHLGGRGEGGRNEPESPPPGAIIGSVVGVLCVIAVLFLLIAWPFKKPPADQWAVSYGGGPFESQHYQGTFEPGSSFRFNGWFDKWFEYPATVRSYIVSKKGGEGDVDSKDSIRATTNDQQQVQYEI
ncbi:MAG: hypothetical protein U1D32_00145, partial [Patescibacteria group bacterium]|nr:hypothetical protein [Patescibacteria group bacterium]